MTMGLDSERTQRERYRVLIEDVADGFFETNLRGQFTFFNDALCRIFGYDRAEIENRSFREFMDVDNAAIAFDSFNDLFVTGRSAYHIHWEILRKDGEKRYLETSASLIVDDYGQKVGFRGIARDITDRYLAQQALKESQECVLEQYRTSARAERRFRTLLEFLPDPVFVLDMDNRVTYLNPAFTGTFGWTLKELAGKRIPFIPHGLKEQTRKGTQKLFQEKLVSGFETQRLTKDERSLHVLLDAAIFYEDENEPAGQVVLLRDITKEKQVDRTNQALFRIARALPSYQDLETLLKYIIGEVQQLVGVEGASVILLDKEKQEFFFHAAAYDDTRTGEKIKEIRFPVDKGVAGQVYRTGQPLIVPDTSQSPYFFHEVDQKSQYQTRNMLDVPIRTQEEMIGVLCAVNKKQGEFTPADVDLLSTVASTVALPVANARVNQALNKSYNEVQNLNRAKDRVIHHLSHELKTPVSVLGASLRILEKQLSSSNAQQWQKSLLRARRNLKRLLEMQYEIEDILREGHYRTHRMLTHFIEACGDTLEALAQEYSGSEHLAEALRRRIDGLFGPGDVQPEQIELCAFVEDTVANIRPRMAHRGCRLELNPCEPAWTVIPSEVLIKTVTGLIRNAVENTPDGSCVEIEMQGDAKGATLIISDRGVGITEQDQKLIMQNYFSARETMQYASRQPFDFAAGGKGFDLLRMQFFAERYGFAIQLQSERCRFIPKAEDQCPGAVQRCAHCHTADDCLSSGGTIVKVTFISSPTVDPNAPTVPAGPPVLEKKAPRR
jgi:PAS domain S-box-containing protein